MQIPRKYVLLHPLNKTTGCSSARLEYASGGRVVAGSNPVTPTDRKAKCLIIRCLAFLSISNCTTFAQLNILAYVLRYISTYFHRKKKGYPSMQTNNPIMILFPFRFTPNRATFLFPVSSLWWSYLRCGTS